jgi:hypothetical protein
MSADSHQDQEGDPGAQDKFWPMQQRLRAVAPQTKRQGILHAVPIETENAPRLSQFAAVAQNLPSGPIRIPAIEPIVPATRGRDPTDKAKEGARRRHKAIMTPAAPGAALVSLRGATLGII